MGFLRIDTGRMNGTQSIIYTNPVAPSATVAHPPGAHTLDPLQSKSSLADGGIEAASGGAAAPAPKSRKPSKKPRSKKPCSKKRRSCYRSEDESDEDDWRSAGTNCDEDDQEDDGFYAAADCAEYWAQCAEDFSEYAAGLRDAEKDRAAGGAYSAEEAYWAERDQIAADDCANALAEAEREWVEYQTTAARAIQLWWSAISHSKSSHSHPSPREEQLAAGGALPVQPTKCRTCKRIPRPPPSDWEHLCKRCGTARPYVQTLPDGRQQLRDLPFHHFDQEGEDY
jgi:hypothetical protein